MKSIILALLFMFCGYCYAIRPVNTNHNDFGEVDTELANIYSNMQPKIGRIQRVNVTTATMNEGEPVIVSTNGVVRIYWKVNNTTYSVQISS